jgi:peptidoglycan/xylan/chitin deacetylase (PgdA/CDA1 family)
MSRARVAALRAVKVTAAALDAVRRPPRGVVVLLYHRVGAESGLELDISTQAFTEQMEILRESERAATLDRALHVLDGTEMPARDPVVVTFDDGTADFADRAVPVLARFGIPATLYLATDFVERQRPFPWGAPPLSWAALSEARATGLIEVGSHTHTHAVLDQLAPDEIADELDRSRRLIEDHLDAPARHFAYPKGMAHSRAADEAVRRRFSSAALGRSGVNGYGNADTHRLRRSPIQATDGARWFTRKLDGGLALEGTLRELLNRRRYAKATS